MGDTATLRLVRSEQEIEADVCRLAREIARDYRGKEVVLVGALTGAFVFMADLVRALSSEGLDVMVSFVGIETYDNQRQSSGNPRITMDLKVDVTGLHVLVCDELRDKGHTLETLMEMLRVRGAASVKSVIYAIKEGCNEVGREPDYVGCTLPAVWVVGYGRGCC